MAYNAHQHDNYQMYDEDKTLYTKQKHVLYSFKNMKNKISSKNFFFSHLILQSSII